MLENFKNDFQGAYYLYTGISFIGFNFFVCFLPETKGKTLEEVESLFAQPWLVCNWRTWKRSSSTKSRAMYVHIRGDNREFHLNGESN